MAKSPKATKPAASNVMTVAQVIENLMNARFAGLDAVTAADEALTLARSDALGKIRLAISGASPVTETVWDASYKDAFRVALKAAKRPNGELRFNGDASINVEMSRSKVAVLAFTNAEAHPELLPNDDEKNLQAFVSGVRHRLAAVGLMEAAKPSTPREPLATKAARLEKELAAAKSGAVATTQPAANVPAADVKAKATVNTALNDVSTIDLLVGIAHSAKWQATPQDAAILLQAMSRMGSDLIKVVSVALSMTPVPTNTP